MLILLSWLLLSLRSFFFSYSVFKYVFYHLWYLKRTRIVILKWKKSIISRRAQYVTKAMNQYKKDKPRILCEMDKVTLMNNKGCYSYVKKL